MKLYALITFLFVDCFAQNPVEILDKYYRAVGGIENWQDLRTAYIESRSLFLGSKLNALSGSDSDTTIERRYRAWPDKGASFGYSDSVLVYSGYHVGKKSYFIFHGLPTPPIEKNSEEFFEFEPVMVRNVVAKGKSVQMVGAKDLFSVQCFDIKIDTRDLIWHLYFNVDDHLLVAWSNSPFDTETTVTRVFDYRKIDNLLMAFGEEKSNHGKVFFWSERTRVNLNVPIDDRVFDYKGKP